MWTDAWLANAQEHTPFLAQMDVGWSEVCRYKGGWCLCVLLSTHPFLGLQTQMLLLVSRQYRLLGLRHCKHLTLEPVWASDDL